MNLESVYIISDTHFGHRNVLKPEYDGRPFPDIETHDKCIIENVLDKLPPGSTLVHVGDVIGFNWKAAVPFLEALRKHRVSTYLVIGNHDDAVVKKLKDYFVYIGHGLYLHLDEEKFYFSHYSCRTWRSSNRGSYHVHGHSHGALPRLGRSLDAGINCNNRDPYHPWQALEVVDELHMEPHLDHHDTQPGNYGREDYTSIGTLSLPATSSRIIVASECNNTP